MSSKLIQRNNLSRDGSGVYRAPGIQGVTYSDGTEQEEYLLRSIAGAKDTGSCSDELQSLICDWPTEYHLSARRANLLRPFDLGKAAAVLELGCGCGAITRYLGESGHHVDAVEGAIKRAEIASQRCRDLGNVNIISADFNDLDLPEMEYDVAIFIGVLEYAKRFWPEKNENVAPRDAVTTILRSTCKTLKPSGILIVAIENKIGLKYWLGCREDHGGTQYESLHGYPHPRGIRTYSRSELNEIITGCGFNHTEFFYPFGDYKVPTIILSDRFIREHAHADATIHQMISRDYKGDYRTQLIEPLVWETLQHSGLLAEFANSFLVFASRERDLSTVYDFDFASYSSGRRRACYATVTKKLKDSDRVTKSYLLPDGKSERSKNSIVEHNIEESNYIYGESLSDILLKAACQGTDLKCFYSSLKKYYEFLETVLRKEQSGSANYAYDCTFWNVIQKDSGELQRFDLEWGVRFPISAPAVLFRSLVMWFAKYGRFLQHFAEKHRFKTVRQAVLAVFGKLGLAPSKSDISTFLKKCEKFHSAVGSGPSAFKSAFEQPFPTSSESIGEFLRSSCRSLWWKIRRRL